MTLIRSKLKESSFIRDFQSSSLINFKCVKYTNHFFSKQIVSPKFYGSNDVVVCGMNRSGSTLLYNIIKIALSHSILQSKDFYNNEEEYRNLLSQPHFQILRKTHNFSYLLKKRIEQSYTIGYFTHRNILDIIASFIQMGRVDDYEKFIESRKTERLIYNAILFKKINNVKIISYESLMKDKTSVIKQILEDLKINPEDELISKIEKMTSIKEVKKNISKLEPSEKDNNHIDLITGLRSKHINNPTPEKWKKVLSSEQVNSIVNLKAYSLYCKEFGYSI